MSETVALIESPAQLLNVIEWAYQSGEGRVDWDRRDLVIIVLPPGNRATRAQLTRLTDLARSVGIQVRWREVRRGRLTRAAALRAVAADVRGAGRLVLGDPFSGLIELFVTTSRADQIVVVDDGSATVAFAELLESGHSLVRWHLQGRRQLPRPLAARALQRLRSTDLELFTVMPIMGDQRFLRCRTNTYAWTRSRYADPIVQPGADIVGTSLVESGIVAEYSYLTAVQRLAESHQAKHYLAHRRESDLKLRLVERVGLEVVRPELPLELLARRGPVSQTLISFPSTIVHTLPVVLQGTTVELLVCDVAPEWFTAGAAPSSSAFLSGVTDSARRQHKLRTITA